MSYLRGPLTRVELPRLVGSGLVAALYAAGAWMEKYLATGRSGHAFHVALAANVFSMVLLVGAADFLTLFLGWELVSWASFLLMAIAGGIAAKAAMRYLTYAFSGAKIPEWPQAQAAYFCCDAGTPIGPGTALAATAAAGCALQAAGAVAAGASALARASTSTASASRPSR